MHINQVVLRKTTDTLTGTPDATCVLVFGDIAYFKQTDFADRLKAAYPGAAILGCSTAGEISNNGVDDGTCVLTAVKFSETASRLTSSRLSNMNDSQAAGVRIAEALKTDDIRAVLLYGPGTNINGSALVRGLESVLGKNIPVVGGLAGDGGAFSTTYTLGDQGVHTDTVVALGLYGEKLVYGHGSFGGWEPFGPARKVTRCEGNVLYELDSEPALAVYERYLGEYAKDLPASGLLFPLDMLSKDQKENGLIRTILGIDKVAGSLTLAGEIDPDGYLRLMHASTDDLVNGAEAAAEMVQLTGKLDGQPDQTLAILVSCVGRKLVMGDMAEEEVEAVGKSLGQHATLTGFYSYGEIGPYVPENACRLHNQTMTVAAISER